MTSFCGQSSITSIEKDNRVVVDEQGEVGEEVSYIKRLLGNDRDLSNFYKGFIERVI